MSAHCSLTSNGGPLAFGTCDVGTSGHVRLLAAQGHACAITTEGCARRASRGRLLSRLLLEDAGLLRLQATGAKIKGSWALDAHEATNWTVASDACFRRCAACDHCAYFSVGLKFRDCGWFRPNACELGGMSDYPRGFRTFSMAEVRAVAHREGSSADAVVRRSAVTRTRPPKRAPLSAALAEPFLSRVRFCLRGCGVLPHLTIWRVGHPLIIDVGAPHRGRLTMRLCLAMALSPSSDSVQLRRTALADASRRTSSGPQARDQSVRHVCSCRELGGGLRREARQ